MHLIQPEEKPVNRFCRGLLLRPQLALVAAVLAMLGPFLDKPFNIDEPLFVWTARQIHAHPGDPYGFKVNWYGTATPMSQVTKNPPLACYYLALAAAVLGWSERALHFAFLLPALAAILGTYRLARSLCNRPLLAAAATLLTPVFLVSSTTVMSDTTMLAFWVWATVFWIEGMERDDHRRLAGSALVMTLAALTKYFSVCLLPLLVVHGLFAKRRFGRWVSWLLIPATALVGYQWATRALYGQGLLTDAGYYASGVRAGFGVSNLSLVLQALAFTGGCMAMVVFFAPFLWRGRSLVYAVAGVAAIMGALWLRSATFKEQSSLEGSSPALLALQVAFWSVAGIGVLSLSLADVVNRRDASSWLLALWVLGTFLFAAFFNWTINGRSILPMAPAVGILVARRLEQRAPMSGKRAQFGAAVPLVGSAALALLVASADFLFANAVRGIVQEIHTKYSGEQKTMWFLGHWGFQYYMEAAGAVAVDGNRPAMKSGDYVAVPSNNVNVFAPRTRIAVMQDEFIMPGPRWLATMDSAVGGGFYSSIFGPVPFAFGNVSPETVHVGVIVNPPAAFEQN